MKKKGTKCPQTQCFCTEYSTLLRFPLTMFTSSTYPSRPCHTCETPSAVYPLQTDRSSCSLPRQTPVIFIFKHVFHSGNNLIQQFILGKKCLSRFSAGISLSLHEFSFDSSNVKSKIWHTLKFTDPVLSLSNRRKIWSRNLLLRSDTLEDFRLVAKIKVRLFMLMFIYLTLMLTVWIPALARAKQPDCSLHWHVVHLKNAVSVQNPCWADCFESTAHIYF